MCLDDNARPHRLMAVTAYFQSEAMTSLQWQAMSPNLNPIEHVLYTAVVYRQLNLIHVQHLRQLEAVLHRDWQQLPHQHIR